MHAHLAHTHPHSVGFLSLVLLLMLSVPASITAQERPTRRLNIPTLVTAIAFAPDGEALVAWDPAGWSRWDVSRGRPTGREPVIARACERSAVLPRSANGRVVAAQCAGRILFFDAASAATLGERPLQEKQTAATYTASLDGKTIALVLAGDLDTVLVGGLAQGEAATSLDIGAEVEQLTLSASGGRLTVGTWRGVEVRELPGGTLLRTFEGGAAHALSADGRRLAMLADGGVKIFDVDSGQMLREAEGRVAHLRFSPDGSSLVGWTNQRLVLWETASGAARLVLTADEFVAAAISPDNTRLAAVGLERRGEGTASTVGIWQLPAK